MNVKNNKKPLLRGHFHQSMFFVSLGACILLILKSETSLEYISTVVYSLGLLTMFGISAVYHRVYWTPEKRLLLKKLDHCGIYIMIAGTFTPVTLLALSEESGTRLLIMIWSVAALGIIQSIWFVHIPKVVSSLIYIVAGYLVIPYLPELSKSLTNLQLFFLIAGGVVYSIGGLGYGLKRPVFSPAVFGYHEFFHILVSIAAIFHFALIYSLL